MKLPKAGLREFIFAFPAAMVALVQLVAATTAAGSKASANLVGATNLRGLHDLVLKFFGYPFLYPFLARHSAVLLAWLIGFSLVLVIWRWRSKSNAVRYVAFYF